MQPSIDTILVCRALAQLFDEGGHRFSSVIEVGCGSGFIGKFAAVNAPGDSDLQVMLNDIDPAAVRYCRSSGFGARPLGLTGRALSWHYHSGDAVELLSGERQDSYDLIITNPPYIPTSAEASDVENTSRNAGFWEGCGLLVHLLELVMQEQFAVGAHLVVMITSLTLKSRRVCALLAEAPTRGVRVRILLEREIAWKAFYAGNGSGSGYLMATDNEYASRQRIGENEFFIGASPPGRSRTGGQRDGLYGYNWHTAYVLDISRGEI